MLSIGENVYGNYRISSMPYNAKSEAYDDIRDYWQGTDCTTYYDKEEDKWYIISQ